MCVVIVCLLVSIFLISSEVLKCPSFKVNKCCEKQRKRKSQQSETLKLDNGMDTNQGIGLSIAKLK